jgi:putative ABC transport system substrate-binding protein
VEGKNVAIEYRYAEGKLARLPELAAELVRLKVNIIVTYGNESIGAAKKATPTIPIVMGFTGDPVGFGFVESLARPGGNITGLSSRSSELGGKRIELLKEAVPSVSSVFALWHQSSLALGTARKEMRDAARALGVKLQMKEVKDSENLGRAFSSVGKGPTSGVILLSGAFMTNNLKRIVDLAIKNRLPVVHALREFAESGGLMAYGPVRIDEFRRAAWYVDRILKGANPAELPVEQPTKFELIINLKAAKQIGLTIPPNVLARADRVIR